MNTKNVILAIVLLCAVALCANAAEEAFKTLVGPVNVGKVTATSPLQTPFITWGGDIATFYGNGGLATKPDTIFARQGLNLALKPGDNFIQQVRDYMAGRSPFLRGTFHMIGMASEVIGSNPDTKGVVIVQLTWSAGDHCVVRGHVKTVNDLKGKTIALQKGGPHVGLLDDILKTAQLTWDDVKIAWTEDLTGKNGAAELFRKNPAIDACCVISPDMIGLTGGLQSIGSGAEGTVAKSRVLVSTAQLSHSIADVYVCRKDFYDAHRDIVTKFVAGYLKACEEVIELKKQYEAKGSAPYMALLKLAQDIYGKDVMPTLEEDVHGLLSDCTFVGHPGNVAFFNDPKNMHGFEALQKLSLDLAMGRGYARVRCGLAPSGLDYSSDAFLKYLTKTKVADVGRFNPEVVQDELDALSAGGGLDDRTIVSFTIQFKPNQDTFSAEQYGAEYQRVVEMADKYGNALIAIRGHADPTKTLAEVVKAGMKKGILQRVGSKQTGFSYSIDGKPVNLDDTVKMMALIEKGDFDGVQDCNPRATMQAALNLSRLRAEAVRDSIKKFAESKGYRLDATQVQPVGVGIREPFIAKPKDIQEAEKNMRVEFRLLSVTAEAITKEDFDF